MKRIILLVLLITSLAYGQYTNWKSKTAEQLSGITSGVTNIASKSYWTSNAYAQIKVLFDMMEGFSEYTDTTTMKAGPADTSLRVAFLKQRASGDSKGGGWFVYSDSSTLATRIGTAVPDGGAIFDATGTGVVWVRQELLYSQVVPVEWYGTTHTAINSAISFANTIKGMVVVTDTITATDTITCKSDVMVVGEKKNYAVIKRGTGYSGSLLYDGGSGVDNFELNGITIDNTNTNAKVLSFTVGTENFRMVNCVSKNVKTTTAAYLFTATTDSNKTIEFINNQFFSDITNSTTLFSLVHVVNPINAVYAYNKHYGNAAPKFETASAFAGNSRNITIHHNYFEDTNHSCISVRPSGATIIDGVDVSYNEGRDIGWSYGGGKGLTVIGEQVSGSGGSVKNINVTNNRVHGFGAIGIGIGNNGNPESVVVSGNTFDAKFTDGTYNDASTGIHIRGSGDITERFAVSNNIIRNVARHGIIVEGASGHTKMGVISGNVIDTCAYDSTHNTSNEYEAGIYIGPNVSNLQIFGNIIRKAGYADNTTASGIVLARGDRRASIDIFANNIQDVPWGVRVSPGGSGAQNPQDIRIFNNRFLDTDSADYDVGSYEGAYIGDSIFVYNNVGDKLPKDFLQNPAAWSTAGYDTARSLLIYKNSLTGVRTLEVEAYGSCAATNGVKRAILIFGSTKLDSIEIPAASTSDWHISAKISPTSTGGINTLFRGVLADSVAQLNYAQVSESLTADKYLRIVLYLANADDTITLMYWAVKPVTEL